MDRPIDPFAQDPDDVLDELFSEETRRSQPDTEQRQYGKERG